MVETLFVKTRPGETITDGLGTIVTDKGGSVPRNTFWSRSLKRGEITLVKSDSAGAEKNSETKETKRFGTKI